MLPLVPPAAHGSARGMRAAVQCCRLHSFPQLKPGYDGVPKLLEAFEKAIPQKVEAYRDGQLVFFGFTDVGEWHWRHRGCT